MSCVHGGLCSVCCCMLIMKAERSSVMCYAVQDAVANVGCQRASVAEGNTRCMNIYGGCENTEKQKVR